MKDTFLQDIVEHLSGTPKKLPSKYFYNNKGSKLFQMIMDMPEYYLTNSEYEILETQSEAIYHSIDSTKKYEIVEFGAGDGSKTKLLLKEFIKHQPEIIYSPIDISKSALVELEESFKKEIPQLNVNPLNDTYFSALDKISGRDTVKIVLFLGSNIGNFKDEQELEFLRAISKNLTKDDYLFIGFDMRKDPKVVLDAYNDRTGITAQFNLNLLQRINDELGGNFDLNKFKHYPTYDPISGEAKSYLISMAEQTVQIGATEIHFDYAEPIFMEVSKKYSEQQIEELAAKTGFKKMKNFYDCRHFFADSLWSVI